MPGYVVSMSVVTHNSEKYIGVLLKSIIEKVKATDYRVFVIDNKSEDSTVEIVKKINDSRIKILENISNIGFGKAHNQILNIIDSKYHVFINPDITIKDDVIGKMCAYLDGHEDIGILSPKVLYPDGGIQVLPKRDVKLIYLISRRIGLGFLKKYRRQYEMGEESADNAFDIEFATGCFMFIRTELLKKAGGFDERYFIYFEDADLTRTVRKYSRVQYNPDFTVYHSWERGGAKSFKLLCLQIRSMFLYIIKWNRSKVRK